MDTLFSICCFAACSNFLYGSNSPFSHLTKLNSAHPLAVTLVVTQSPHLLAHLSILRSAVMRLPRCPKSAENKSNLYKHLHKQDAAIFYTVYDAGTKLAMNECLKTSERLPMFVVVIFVVFLMLLLRFSMSSCILGSPISVSHFILVTSCCRFSFFPLPCFYAP